MLDRVLFSLGDFDVTVLLLIYAFLVLVLLVGIIAFRRNYILQVKLSRLMDAESAVHNSQGIIVLLKKKRKKLLAASKEFNPTIVIVSLDNMGSLYVGYKNRNYLMRMIAETFAEDLIKPELISRSDFNKFCIVLTDRNREDVKEYIQELNVKLDELDIENYGSYSFFLTAAVYENAKLDDPKLDYELALATLSYATVKDGNIYYYSDEVLAKVKQLEIINSSKESALENGQFVPYVQPKVDFKTGRVTGGEILVRWVDNDQTILYRPDEFIPLFESNGFIKTIDFLMFEQSCSILQILNNAGHKDLVLSTNFSKLTLNSLKTTEKLLEIVSKYNVSPNHIEIEITESESMESANAFSTSLLKLRQNGFRISMDDFGKEYSSLAMLVDNRFDTIKVDKFFFENSLSTTKEKDVIKNIINLLSKVGCHIVLEGIENEATLAVLATIHRDLSLQGYYFSKPIPPSKFEAFVSTIFSFDYPDIVVETEKETISITTDGATAQTTPGVGAAGATINVNTTSTPGKDNSAEVEALRVQMKEMQLNFERQLQAQREQNHKQDMDYMNQQLENLRKQQEQALAAQQLAAQQAANQRLVVHQQEPVIRDYGRDDEIVRLRRELEDLRYQHDRDRDRFYENRYREPRYEEPRYDNRRSEYEDLQRQIKDLKESQQQQPQIDVNALIEKLSQTQLNSVQYQVEKAKEEAQSLRDKLEQERKEREELEALLEEMNNKEEEVSEEEITHVQEEADKNLNLDLSTLSADEKNDDEEEDEAEEESEDGEEANQTEKLEKPALSLEELEAIIKSYQDKYLDNWNKHAKEELKDGYYEVVNGLKYYRGRVKKNFVDKMKQASPEIKQLFNIVKNEIMRYEGITNKMTNSYDTFYYKRKQIAKIAITSSRIKVFLAADPTKYPERQFPHKDVSSKKTHARTPYYTKVKSQLSVKRFKYVLADVMIENELKTSSNYKPIDYAIKFKFLKGSQ